MLALEGEYLKFDYTYRAVGNIWVSRRVEGADGARSSTDEGDGNAKPERVELSYVLGTVFGSTGLVLATLICATEKVTNMLHVFENALNRTQVVPKQICVDDWHKWHGSLEKMLNDRFGVGHGCVVTQDFRHWKELLLAPMDHRHPQFHSARQEVERLLRRLKMADNAEHVITCGADLRDAVRDLRDHFSDRAGRCVLLKASALSHHLTFDVCSSLGSAVLGGYFDVNMDKLATNPEGATLFSARVDTVWEAKLNSGWFANNRFLCHSKQPAAMTLLSSGMLWRPSEQSVPPHLGGQTWRRRSTVGCGRTLSWLAGRI